MKRCAVLLMAFFLLLVLGYAWHDAAVEEDSGGYLLYFQERNLETASGGGALRTENVQLPEADTQETAELLLKNLLAGPRDETLKSTIPAGTTLLSLKLEGSRAVVDLSTSYGTLSGITLTLADQAVTLTLTQLPGISAVKITVRGQELAYRDHQVLTARGVLVAPEGDVVGTVPANLYFLDEKGQLTVESRELEMYEGDTQVSTVIRALEDGPEDKDLSSPLPEGFRVKSVWMEEDRCYVNLSSGLPETLPEDASLSTALRALAKSLCSLETVTEVRFLVDGELAQSYGGVNVARPYIE
jgi:germination protein M